MSVDVACAPCTEFVHCVSAKPLDCGVINRRYSTGDNRSDSLGPFSEPAITSNIVMKVKNCERAVLLSNALVAVGGNGGPGVPAIDPSEVVPKANDLVPLNHHSHDLKEFEELLTCVNSKAAFELRAMDGVMCFQCICNKIPYVGITYSAALQKKITDFVINHIFRSFQTPGHPLFQPDMIEAMNKANIRTLAASSSSSSSSVSTPQAKRARTGGSPHDSPQPGLADGGAAPKASAAAPPTTAAAKAKAAPPTAGADTSAARRDLLARIHALDTTT